MVLDFIFFVDRPKSFKRMYKKKHSFIYKSFFGYIFNRQYIQETKHKKIFDKNLCHFYTYDCLWISSFVLL